MAQRNGSIFKGVFVAGSGRTGGESATFPSKINAWKDPGSGKRLFAGPRSTATAPAYRENERAHETT